MKRGNLPVIRTGVLLAHVVSNGTTPQEEEASMFRAILATVFFLFPSTGPNYSQVREKLVDQHSHDVARKIKSSIGGVIPYSFFL